MEIPVLQCACWIAVSTLFSGSAAAQCLDWQAVPSGGEEPGIPTCVNDPTPGVYAMHAFDDGSGLALYVGGFYTPYSANGNNVRRWNGTSWSDLPVVPDTSTLEAYCMETYEDPGSGSPQLYVGGDMTHGFSERGGVVRWNGTSWTFPGNGLTTLNTADVPPDVYALHASADGSLYAGGAFTHTGTTFNLTFVNHLARWNGTSWGVVSTALNQYVYALTSLDDGSGQGFCLYAGGTFFDVTGVPNTRNLARWNGTAWSPLGGQVNGDVHALTLFDDGSGEGQCLYASGNFGMAGGVACSRIGRWNGTSWSPLGSGLNGIAYALCVFDDGTGFGPALYAAGSFTIAGGVSAANVAKWNGTSWSALGGGVGGGTCVAVRTLAAFDGGVDGGPDIYVGGRFDGVVGGPASKYVVRWRGCGEPGLGYCAGDAIDPVVTALCPCGNVGDPGHGCHNSTGASAYLSASGITSPNTVLLTCDGIPNGALATFMRGPNHDVQGAVFGDGIKCLTSPLFRFGSQNAGTIGNPPSTVGVGAPSEAPGSTVHYVVQHRNSVPGFCAPETFNASNGYTIVW